MMIFADLHSRGCEINNSRGRNIRVVRTWPQDADFVQRASGAAVLDFVEAFLRSVS